MPQQTSLINPIGFKIHWMKLREAKSAEIIWEASDNLTFPNEELRAWMPKTCGRIIREVNFSTVRPMNWFRMEQKLFLKDRLFNEWSFESSSVGERTLTAPELLKLPVEIFNGDIVLETKFFYQNNPIASNRIRFFID
ncbi:retinal rod rhodopsin-sensitive cGMP 3',5'-cyclic phosphodiesterase subunit delta-like [Leptopilina heterotoma]|uniref:retinal rod rhodopsin-sensitive cGMP 3',5'-cyclic phosphodiesterase subunit delta-like n=1 Tax=Leptopilina heterotoma TaxID=63436 RepID=UPI001CA9DA46|nr:retinal rod rhodopsin-sensitive cGMP 3',5'-cyclic phosphodiesterase subunit delta-like [Leptopilina heterotoma]